MEHAYRSYLSQVSKAISIIYRLKDVYPLLVLQTLYNTLILPYFNYCILSWGATISNGNRLHLLQKKVVRLISNSNYIAHTEPIYKSLRLLKLTDMFPIAVWKFYYKLMNYLSILLIGNQNYQECARAMKSEALYFICR